MKPPIGMIVVLIIGALVWQLVMPDFSARMIMGLVWGAAVGVFWALHFPEGSRDA